MKKSVAPLVVALCLLLVAGCDSPTEVKASDVIAGTRQFACYSIVEASAACTTVKPRAPTY